jgi:hypothetical protein
MNFNVTIWAQFGMFCLSNKAYCVKLKPNLGKYYSKLIYILEGLYTFVFDSQNGRWKWIRPVTIGPNVAGPSVIGLAAIFHFKPNAKHKVR